MLFKAVQETTLPQKTLFKSLNTSLKIKQEFSEK